MAWFEEKAGSFRRAAGSFRVRPVLWLLAGAVMALAFGASGPSASSNPGLAGAEGKGTSNRGVIIRTGSSGPPAAPKPAAVDPKELAAAFGKAAPASVADLRSIEQRVRTVVARVSPAVVAVQIGDGSGSGVVISADGLVLTAGHVCGQPNRDVRFAFPDGRTARGKTMGADVESDTGLLRITTPGVWPCVPVGDLERARVGDWVLALGHPGGFDARRSLVVRLGRIIRRTPWTMQTDCTISPGDSGGPLFDMYGRVIGIHSFISTSMADNFHVPITEFYDTWDELVSVETRFKAEQPRN